MRRVRNCAEGFKTAGHVTKEADVAIREKKRAALSVGRRDRRSCERADRGQQRFTHLFPNYNHVTDLEVRRMTIGILA